MNFFPGSKTTRRDLQNLKTRMRLKNVRLSGSKDYTRRNEYSITLEKKFLGHYLMKYLLNFQNNHHSMHSQH